MFLQPCGGFHFDFLNVGNAITHQGAAEHRDICPRHYYLDYVVCLINATGRGEVGADFSVKNANPMQRQAHVGGYAQREIWRDLHLLEIDVRLVKSVEQNQPIRAECIETLGHICKTAKIRAELYRQGDLGGRSYGPDSINICFLDCTASNFRLGRYPIDVKF